LIHHHLYRARLYLIGSMLFAVILVGVEFPFSLLMRQRAQISTTSAALANLTSRNSALNGDIKALRQPSTIGVIAHEEYGLVLAGQSSYVILPAAGTSAANALPAASIPPRDLVATTATPGLAASTAKASGPGLWRRFLDRLEFWRLGG
jgi:hypothetical protein